METGPCQGDGMGVISNLAYGVLASWPILPLRRHRLARSGIAVFMYPTSLMTAQTSMYGKSFGAVIFCAKWTICASIIESSTWNKR